MRNYAIMRRKSPKS